MKQDDMVGLSIKHSPPKTKEPFSIQLRNQFTKNNVTV